MGQWGQESQDEAKQFQGGDIKRLSMKERKYTIRIMPGGYKLFRQHWIQAVNRSINCDGINCVLCQKGEKGQLKYVANVLDREDNQIKLWEFGRKVKVTIETIAADYGSPEGYDLIVVRKGMKADNTVYTIMPARDIKALTEEEAAMPLYDLEKLYAVTPAEKVAAYLRGEIPAKQEDEGAPRQGRTETSSNANVTQAPAVGAVTKPEDMVGPDDLPTL